MSATATPAPGAASTEPSLASISGSLSALSGSLASLSHPSSMIPTTPTTSEEPSSTRSAKMETATNVGEGYTYNSSTIVRVALAAGIIVLGVCALLLFMKVSRLGRDSRSRHKARKEGRGGTVLPAPCTTLVSWPAVFSNYLSLTCPSLAHISFGADPRSPGGCATANA